MSWRSALALASAVVLCGLGLHAAWVELPRVMERPLPGEGVPPSQWKLGWPQTEGLREGLMMVRGRVPEGALVAVEAPSLDGPELFFLSMWCAYDLPRHTVVRRALVEERHVGARGSFLLRWLPTEEPSGDELVRTEWISVRPFAPESAGEVAAP